MSTNHRTRLYRSLAVAAVLVALAGPAAAEWRYPAYQRMNFLAQELAEAARNVHRNAEGRVERMGYGSPQTLATLHILEDQARHFSREVSHDRNYRHAAQDFRELQRTYLRASATFDRIPAGSYLRHEFRRVGLLIAQLDVYFDDRGRYSRRYWSHPRH